MLILSKCGTLMRDMKDSWNICKLWDTCIYLKLKGNVSRCFCQFQRLHCWIWACTVRHYNSRRGAASWLIRGCRDKQVSIMQTLESSCAAFSGSPPWQTTTSGNTYAFQEASTALLWATWKCGSGWDILRTPKTNPLPRPNWHPHKGGNKGMYLWASGCGSVRSVHW